jgi:hypothetical protein
MLASVSDAVFKPRPRAEKPCGAPKTRIQLYRLAAGMSCAASARPRLRCGNGSWTNSAYRYEEAGAEKPFLREKRRLRGVDAGSRADHKPTSKNAA